MTDQSPADQQQADEEKAHPGVACDSFDCLFYIPELGCGFRFPWIKDARCMYYNNTSDHEDIFPAYRDLHSRNLEKQSE